MKNRVGSLTNLKAKTPQKPLVKLTKSKDTNEYY